MYFTDMAEGEREEEALFVKQLIKEDFFMEVPKIDFLEDDPMSAMDDKIREDPDEPNTITVYYWLTNGDCVRGKYNHVQASRTVTTRSVNRIRSWNKKTSFVF